MRLSEISVTIDFHENCSCKADLDASENILLAPIKNLIASNKSIRKLEAKHRTLATDTQSSFESMVPMTTAFSPKRNLKCAPEAQNTVFSKS